MDSLTEQNREIYNEFLNYWTIEKIEKMSLSEYVSIGNRDTLCQWLETKTRELGSIKGINSSKFGIYKRSNTTKKPQKLVNDKEYSWQRYYSNSNKSEAFNNIKKEILQIINYAQIGNFKGIDELHLTVFVKWKIAFLFSNERLIPIFKKEVLLKIAKHYGLIPNRHTTIAEIQELMIANKPAHYSIYEFSEKLYNQFGRDQKKSPSSNRKRISRKSTNIRNTNSQLRKGSSTYIASQKHNQLQQALYNRLVKLYGKKCVFMEGNYVDIKVILEDEILLYEVKSASYASDCIKSALGQILSYSFREEDKRKIKLIVAGHYRPNDDEKTFISYINKNLKLNFSYESIDL
jgi:hypothetical protein